MALTDILRLSTSSLYSNPDQQNQFLPIVYGNTAENSDGGVYVVPCIDTVNGVYCLAAHAIYGDVTVYEDGVVTSGTIVLNGSYEGKGQIAYITLPGATGTITAKCKGRMSATGDLLTNPVDIIEDLLTLASSAGITVPSLQPSASVLAKAQADSKGYTGAGVIAAENTIAFWLQSILSSFLGEYTLSSNGDLIVRLDTDVQTGVSVAGILSERRSTTQGRFSLSNIFNRIPVNYAVSYTEIDRRYKEGADSSYYRSDDGVSTQDVSSQTLYGIREPKNPLPLDWTRNTNTVTAVQSRLIEKLAQRTWLYDVEEQGLRNIHVEPGDYVAFSWENRYDENDLVMRNQICQVLSKEVDLDMQIILWSLRDTGDYLIGAPDLADGSRDVGDGGAFGGTRDRRILA